MLLKTGPALTSRKPHSIQVAPITSRGKLTAVCALRSAKRLKYSGLNRPTGDVKIVHVESDGGDTWRLQPILELIKGGAVGIIPTDTLPAIVCDLENRDAVLRLYAVKDMDPKKPLSILCRDFKDIAHYTGGLPVSNEPGSRNWFNTVRRILPGPYTLILPASKNLPSLMVDFMKAKTIHRKSVGVRIPADAVCQAVLEGVGHPLLCTSVHVVKNATVPDVGSMLEAYGGNGIDFIVDVGPCSASLSTVVDMTGPDPEVIRVGSGDPSMFE